MATSTSTSATLKSQDNTPPHASVSNSSSKGPETISIAALKATMETAGHAVATVCAGHEKSCVDMAMRAVKVTADADPLAALIGPETAQAAQATPNTHNQVADAAPTTTIPLPPRREPVPQRKI
ncbi:MAG: hypothetical protein FJX04_03865 [Alphaproteobacteria bacterium]|nr:hypothetical protein [Alphaproteobacteria bacterium]